MFVGQAIAGVGFGAAFTAALGLIIPLVAAHQRAGVVAGIYVVSYLGFGVPVVVAGQLTGALGVVPTVGWYSAVAVLLALLSLGAQRAPRPRRPAANGHGGPAATCVADAWTDPTTRAGHMSSNEPKRVFLAGASGVIGQRLIPRLVEAGYVVGGMTRSAGQDRAAQPPRRRTDRLRRLRPRGPIQAVRDFAPDVILNELTDLPDDVAADRRPRRAERPHPHRGEPEPDRGRAAERVAEDPRPDRRLAAARRARRRGRRRARALRPRRGRRRAELRPVLRARHLPRAPARAPRIAIVAFKACMLEINGP